MGTLGDSSVGPCDLSQLCPAGALDGRCSGEGTPGTSSLQLVICRSTPAILLSSTANGNIPKWKCRNNLELKAAFVHSLIEKLPFSPDTLQPLNRSCILIFPTINPHQQSLCYSTGVLQKAKRLQKGKLAHAVHAGLKPFPLVSMKPVELSSVPPQIMIVLQQQNLLLIQK